MSVTNDSLAVDINAGLDYERARARLNQDAGRAFRQYMSLKNNPATSTAASEAARKAYVEASVEYKQLRFGDTVAIAEILGGAL